MIKEVKFTASDASAVFKKIRRAVLPIVVIIILIVLMVSSMSVINEGFIGVRYRLGKIVQADITAGLVFRIQFIETIRAVDVREHLYQVEDTAYTRDTQQVQQLRLKLNYSYKKDTLTDLIKNIGIENVEERLIRPDVAKIAKDKLGNVNAEEHVQSRREVQQSIQDELTKSLAIKGITVDSFAIENLQFDDAFQESIQAKVIAGQDALKMENKTREKTEEAKQTVIAAQAKADSQLVEAEAQAKAILLIQEQIEKSPQYIEYLKIQQWNGILPQVIGDGVNPFVSIGGNAMAGVPAAQ